MKILFFDIETAPNIAYIWGLWTETRSMNFVEQSWYTLCWCAKWIDEKKVYSSALPDFKSYKRNPESDKEVMKALWDLLNEADIVIAHNAIKFDVKKVNARFIINGMNPPSPYKVIDTLRVARRYFAFTSNKLNDLGVFLKLGKKLETGGFDLWKKCLRGDKKAWNRMVKYCKTDVTLLEKIYKKLRPYISHHPNLSVYTDDPGAKCPKCDSDKLVKEGVAHTNAGQYQRYSCKDCGGWCRGKKNLLDNKVTTTNA